MTDERILEMARRIAADHVLNKYNQKLIREGRLDTHPAVNSALAAIKEATELAAKLADQRLVADEIGPALCNLEHLK